MFDYKRTARIIRQHYQLDREPTSEEVAAEIANLRRRDAKGFLDDMTLQLFIALGLNSSKNCKY